MTFTSLLNRTVQVWRTADLTDPDVPVDEGGYPVEDWQLIEVELAARITPVSDREGITVDATAAVIETFAIATDLSDITERDRLVDDASGVYRVDQVHRQDDAYGPHHLELLATKLTG